MAGDRISTGDGGKCGPNGGLIKPNPDVYVGSTVGNRLGGILIDEVAT